MAQVYPAGRRRPPAGHDGPVVAEVDRGARGGDGPRPGRRRPGAARRRLRRARRPGPGARPGGRAGAGPGRGVRAGGAGGVAGRRERRARAHLRRAPPGRRRGRRHRRGGRRRPAGRPGHGRAHPGPGDRPRAPPGGGPGAAPPGRAAAGPADRAPRGRGPGRAHGRALLRPRGRRGDPVVGLRRRGRGAGRGPPLSAPGGGVAVRDDVRPAARRRRTATRGGPGGRRRVRGRSTMVRMTWTGFGIVTPLLLVLTVYLAVLGALSVGEGVGARLTFAGVFLAGAVVHRAFAWAVNS